MFLYFCTTEFWSMRREQGEGSPAKAHVVYVALCLRVAYICYVTVVMRKKRGKV